MGWARLSGKNLGLIENFSESVPKKTARSAVFKFFAAAKLENPTLVPRQRRHFRAFWVFFCAFLFLLKQGVWR